MVVSNGLRTWNGICRRVVQGQGLSSTAAAYCRTNRQLKLEFADSHGCQILIMVIMIVIMVVIVSLVNKAPSRRKHHPRTEITDHEVISDHHWNNHNCSTRLSDTTNIIINTFTNIPKATQFQTAFK